MLVLFRALMIDSTVFVALLTECVCHNSGLCIHAFSALHKHMILLCETIEIYRKTCLLYIVLSAWVVQLYYPNFTRLVQNWMCMAQCVAIAVDNLQKKWLDVA